MWKIFQHAHSKLITLLLSSTTEQCFRHIAQTGEDAAGNNIKKMYSKEFLWRQSQKFRTPPTKKFFRVQSTRLADPFEPLNSFLAQSAEELGRW